MTVRCEQGALLGGTVSWLANGTPAEVRASDRVVLLLHGIPSSAELWRGVLGELGAAGLIGIAPDLPGYHPTRLPVEVDHGIPGMVEVALALLDDLGIERARVVGHDLGGVAAQLLAVDHPDRVAGVTFSHAPIEDRWPPPAMRPVFAAARLGMSRAVAPLLCRSTVASVTLGIMGGSGGRGAWSRRDARRVFLGAKATAPEGIPAFAAHVEAVARTNTSLTARTAPLLAGIEVPTQLVWGTEDVHQPWDPIGTRLRELLPDPAVTIVQGAGHFLPGERPDEFAAALIGAVTGDPSL